MSCLLAAPASAATTYTWRDENGVVHLADDLSKVPPRYRPYVERRTEDADSRRWNAVVPPTSWNRAPAAVNRTTPGPNVGAKHVLHVQRAGREMLLSATLDGTPNLPFVVDTGAMLNTIPRWAAVEMGVDLGDDLPRTSIVGIGGEPMLVPVITVATVRIGSAVVENVEMAVVSTMNKGLLGMPFFNHFRVSTDPTKGTLTLEEIDLDAVEGVFGGLDESTWRSKFGQVYHQLRQIERRRENIPPEFETQSADYRAQLDEQERYWRRQLDDLETKATRARVPQAWREWRE